MKLINTNIHNESRSTNLYIFLKYGFARLYPLEPRIFGVEETQVSPTDPFGRLTADPSPTILGTAAAAAKSFYNIERFFFVYSYAKWI